MTKVISFIVKKRVVILAIALVITVICGFLFQLVEVNTDMTKYLPDDSAMKTGMDLMETEFPETETTYTIRVMVDDLKNSEKEEFQQKLENIENVDSVSYDIASDDYNKDNHTLFVISTLYDYNSDEEAAIEKTLENEFADYELTFKNDNDATELQMNIIILAIGILMLILFVMCGSWIEPILFLITIGIAVVINMGTNFFLGGVSEVTSSIAAILQLVLSMDYSIILINRYRQELPLTDNKNQAMKIAIRHSFGSIASSAVTTIVGLIMLVFMSFKIGADLGIVLAKGVFISMLCIFTILPGLILIFDKVIKKTTKPVPHFRMRALATFSNKFRYVIVGVFVVIFAAAFILKGSTGYTYTLSDNDPIADIFPPTNTIVMLYDNKDEEAVTKITKELEGSNYIKDVSNYSTTLGKEFTADELASQLDDYGMDMEFDESLLSILYYHYYKNGETGNIEMSDFLTFLSEDVLTNETFAEHIPDDLSENVDTLEKFADADSLTTKMSAASIADFFGMDKGDIDKLFLYYFIENGGVNTGTMTLPVFADFVVNHVAEHPDYSDMFNSAALSQMKTLLTYTDSSKMTALKSYSDIAKMLDMDAETAKLLYVYYYASSGSYSPGSLTLPTLSSFIGSDVMSNPSFSSYFGSGTSSQINMLTKFTNKSTLQSKMTGTQLAGLFGLDSSMANQIIYMYYANTGATNSWTMSLSQFTNFLADSVLTNNEYAGYFDAAAAANLKGLNQMINTAVSGASLSSTELAGITGMDAETIDQLFAYMSAITGSEVKTMTLPEFLDFMLDTVANDPMLGASFDEATIAQLSYTRQLVQTAVSGSQLSAAQLGQLMDIDENMTGQMFYLYFSTKGETAKWTMTPEKFVDFLLGTVASDSNYSNYFNKSTVEQLSMLQGIIKATLSNKTYSYSEAAKLFSMDSSTMKMLYTYYAANHGGAGSWALSTQNVVNFLVNNSSQFGSVLDSGSLADLKMAQSIINGSVSGKKYSAKELANLVGMSAEQANQLYLLYISEHGDTSDWKMSVETFVDFIITDVLADEDLSSSLDSSLTSELETADTLIDAVISGKKFSSKQLAELFGDFSDDLSENSVDMLYLYYFSAKQSDPSWTLSMHTLFDYLSNNILSDSRFDEFLGDSLRTDILDLETQLNDGLKQLQGPNYSRLVFTTTLPDEGDETTEFLDSLMRMSNNSLKGKYYLIGNSVMNYEMAQTFDSEMNFITLLTAIAIFLVVALTFRSITIPTVLVLIIQCGVFITICAIGLQGYSIYYLALLIVQCILMGATIDYGILFTSYYTEKRETMSRRDAIEEAYGGSMHTIMTSGLIMILVTGLLGFLFENPVIGQICQTISIGALCATLLIVFVLPGMLAAFDGLISKKAKRERRRRRSEKRRKSRQEKS